MRSLYPTPKPRPQDQQKPSRPESRQSSLSAAGIAKSEDTKTVKRKPSATTILTRTPVNRITATTTTTTTTPPSSLFRTRTPLRPRDHNVAPATTRRPLATPMRNLKAAPTTTMPPLEKDAAPTMRRPQMPTLAKNINRAPPVTPKIAAKVAAVAAAAAAPSPHQQQQQQQQQQQHQHQTVTVATPLPRRTAPRPDSASRSEVAFSGVGQQRDEFVSPVSAFLGTNVTPRSGSRQIRVDSANTTPNGTPHLDRSDSWETRSGLGISSPSLDERIRQAPPSLVGGGKTTTTTTTTTADSKFFFASDAKQQTQQAAPPPPPPPLARPLNPVQKASTFFYANGSTLPGGSGDNASSTSFTPVLGPSTPTATVTPDPLSSKFVYANGAPELQSPLKTTFPPAPGSTVSTTSRAPSRPPTVAAPTSYPSQQRPPSPVKIPSYPATKNGPQLALNRAAMASAPQLVATSTALRQTSNESKTSTHSRNGSLSVAEPVAVSRLLASLPGSSASSPVIAAANPSGGLASILQMAEDMAESDDGKLYSELHSPTKSTHAQDQLDELVVTARRERKVQDLEITNASLEAINRSLERQLRKQKAELRQFRRLSRSGRLSLAPSTRIASTSTVEGPLNDPAHMLYDLSEGDSEPEDDDDFEDDESEYSDSESGSGSDISPGIVAKRDARHRKQDEKRLQLDLSKHRQLLVDSQKINQSIKRCLGWTEELIKEGKKALEFQVRVSEVELGGRVLAPQDEDEDSDKEGEGSRVEDDTIRLRLDHQEEPPSEWGDKETQDRDSGVEMPVDGG